MSDNNPRRPRIMQSRAKAILSMIPEHNTTNLPEPAAVHNEAEKNNIEVRSMIDTLYSRPFSLTGPVFSKFCETQTTYSSHYSHGLGTNINILKKAFPDIHEIEKSKEDIFLASHENDSQQLNNQLESMFDPKNLLCNEEMPPQDSTPLNSPAAAPSPEPGRSGFELLELNSDDSVLDKDYCPSGDESRDSIEEFSISRPKAKKVKKDIPTSESVELIQQTPRRVLKRNVLHRRSTVDGSQPRRIEFEKPRKRRYSTHNLGTINDGDHQSQPLESCNNIETPQRKRKKYTASLSQRKMEAKNRKRMNYCIKPGCNENCLKKCMTIMSQKDREDINEMFWNLTWQQRQTFVASHTSTAMPKRKSTTPPQRKSKRVFTLKKVNGISTEVCKIFFLTTLGYKKSNDRILYNSFTETDIDKRGRHRKTPAYDRDLLTQHVETFRPMEPHYRREHAPLRRYIPSDINITSMHKDFIEKHPNQKMSYELYRKHVNHMNISFTRLGNEECEVCEAYRLHKLQTSHDAINQIVAECDQCVNWACHHEKYKNARELYDLHRKLPYDETEVFVSSDLEKVIMLPRMESFKSVIFSQRLVAYNQTFAPLGKITTENKPMTIIWHDGIAGRKQEDIMSAFYWFILRHRDIKNINIWLDNCSAQNKNWLLYSLLVYMVNSDLIATNSITLFYFEPGHTFMSCDQVHHQVELAMKKKPKIYDFADFEEAVASINHTKVVVKASLAPEHFINVPNFVSDRRIQTSTPRAYLKNMSQVCFQRKNFDLQYKNKFDDEYTMLRFMNDKYLKNPTTMAITFRSSFKGVDSERKQSLLTKLSDIIPAHKLTFWKNLPVNNNDQTSVPRSRRNT